MEYFEVIQKRQDQGNVDYETEAVVIGAGVIGLAIGRALALQGVETVVLERASNIGSETSSRNSEVIHAGLYYPPGSLKSRYCVTGRELLYEYLQSHALPYSRCGKLLVATDQSEMPRMREIADRALRNGVTNLRMLRREEVSELEPLVKSWAGLFSPSTGILDTHQFMLSLLGEFEAAGGMLALNSGVTGGSLARRGPHAVICEGESAVELGCRVLINATGLRARDTWFRLAGCDTVNQIPPQYFAKGHYYAYSGKRPFSHLVYPVPLPGGLGVHATLDLGGQVRFGPDVSWVSAITYEFDDNLREDFISAIRRYYPELDVSRLHPAYTGIRPKVVGPGIAAGDFVILTAQHHGIPGYISLHGIESPGLTACLAIAEDIAATMT